VAPSISATLVRIVLKWVRHKSSIPDEITKYNQLDPNTVITPTINESMVGTILYCYDGLLTSAPQICVWDIRSPQSPAAAVQNPREKGMVTRLHYNSSFAPESSTSDPPRAEGSCLSSSSSCGDDLTPQQSKDALEGHADIQTATSTCGDGTITPRGSASGLVSVSGKGLFAAGFESGEVCCYDLRMNCRY
jgi:hypothetical protein